MIELKSSPETHYSAIRALLVEDDWAFRNIITRQLSKLGCNVQSSGNASEFFAKLLNVRMSVDLVVVDLQLPGLNGDKIISWIRQSEISDLRALPILVITGFPQAFPSNTQLDGYPIKLLKKPYRFAQLQDAITELLVNGTKH